MATQITAYPQAQLVPLEAFRQLSAISDNVNTNLSLGHILPVQVPTSVFPPGSQILEELKARLELITKFQFVLRADHAGGTVLWPIAKPMSSGSPANSADTAVDLTAEEQSISASTPSTNDVASTQKKIPRPKNAFMIYRLQYHSKVASANPGMHNNDISKKIGLQWRSEKPEVIESFKRQAEEEKRQHAITHPGYRYQPRKPSEKKKRMTKNKLAKLAAKSGSSNTIMDVSNIPDSGEQFYLASAAEPFDFNNVSWDTAPVDDFSFDFSSDLAGQYANTGMFPTTSQASTEPSANHTTTHQPVVEQHRQEGLDSNFAVDKDGFGFAQLLHLDAVGDGVVLEDTSAPVPANFDPSLWFGSSGDGI